MRVAFTAGEGGVVPVTSAPSMATKEPAAALNAPEGTLGLSVQGASPRASGTAPGNAGEHPDGDSPVRPDREPPRPFLLAPNSVHTGAPSPSPRKDASSTLCAPELRQSRDPVMTFLLPFIG